MKLLFFIIVSFINTQVWLILIAYELINFYEAITVRNKILNVLEKEKWKNVKTADEQQKINY